MSTFNLEISKTTTRLLEAIATIPKDVLNNNNKEKLNEIADTLISLAKMSLLLDQKEPSKQQMDSSVSRKERENPTEQPRTQPDTKETKNQPGFPSTGQPDLVIPAHQPETDPIGNYSKFDYYILYNNNQCIELSNDDIFLLFNSFIDNNLFGKNFERFKSDNNIDISYYLDFFNNNWELKKNTTLFFNDLRNKNITTLSFNSLNDFHNLKKSLQGFFYNKKNKDFFNEFFTEFFSETLTKFLSSKKFLIITM